MICVFTMFAQAKLEIFGKQWWVKVKNLITFLWGSFLRDTTLGGHNLRGAHDRFTFLRQGGNRDSYYCNDCNVLKIFVLISNLKKDGIHCNSFG